MLFPLIRGGIPESLFFQLVRAGFRFGFLFQMYYTWLDTDVMINRWL